ncbi:hypothetical protein KCP76_13630 [Salmonella enterica subsp. enterica serovar Weltevreden]|nr:hypothetical protein KCP76_13630 [Salmonella enterica subsp. enterica serovar Weltevreden]
MRSPPAFRCNFPSSPYRSPAVFAGGDSQFITPSATSLPSVSGTDSGTERLRPVNRPAQEENTRRRWRMVVKLHPLLRQFVYVGCLTMRLHVGGFG